MLRCLTLSLRHTPRWYLDVVNEKDTTLYNTNLNRKKIVSAYPPSTNWIILQVRELEFQSAYRRELLFYQIIVIREIRVIGIKMNFNNHLDNV